MNTIDKNKLEADIQSAMQSPVMFMLKEYDEVSVTGPAHEQAMRLLLKKLRRGDYDALV